MKTKMRLTALIWAVLLAASVCLADTEWGNMYFDPASGRTKIIQTGPGESGTTTIANPPTNPMVLGAGVQCSFVFAASDTTKTCTITSADTNSLTQSIKIVMPNFSATTPTFTFTIKDPAGSTLYSIAGLPEAATWLNPAIERPLMTGSQFIITLTTTAGTGGGTATADFFRWK
jgi:hypothetical protein